MESFGITDPNFITPLYSQLIKADGFGGNGVEFAVAVLKGTEPSCPARAAAPERARESFACRRQ